MPAVRPSGLIAGRLVDPTGTPIARATVKLIRLSPTRWTSRVSRTSLDGSFSVSGLDAGEYAVCGEAPQTLVLVNPCVWLGAAGQRTISIKSGQQSQENVVRFLPGRSLLVEVKDPQRVLVEQAESKAQVGRQEIRTFQIEVQGPGNSIPRPLRAARPTPDGVLYETVIPAGETVQLRIHTKGLALSDEAQRPLANNRADQSIAAPAEARVLRHTFHVSRLVGAK